MAWTLFVWVSRLRNVWADADLSTGGQWLRTGYAGVFLALAVVASVLLRRSRRRQLGSSDVRVLWLFLAWTVGFWLIRGIGIIVDDHDLGFTVIHTVLMIISLGFAGHAASGLRREPTSAPISASLVG